MDFLCNNKSLDLNLRLFLISKNFFSILDFKRTTKEKLQISLHEKTYIYCLNSKNDENKNKVIQEVNNLIVRYKLINSRLGLFNFFHVIEINNKINF